LQPRGEGPGEDKGYRGWFRFYSIATLLVLVGFGTASSIAMGGLEEDLTPWAGGFERINAYAFFAWLVVLAVTMLRRSLGQVTPGKGVAETEVVQTSEPSLVARVTRKPRRVQRQGIGDGFTPGPLSPVT
jgi:hypothetical protein